MNLKTKIILFSFALLALFSFQQGFALAGFGISPPSVVNKDLVPGSSFVQDVYLLQSVSDSDLNVDVTVNVPQIADWIKIENGNSFVITKGTQKFPMKVDINVPSNAKLGEYKGTINIKTSPVGKQADGVSVNVGANIAVDLVVSSKTVSNFSIENFQILDSQKGSPIVLSMKVKNVGNVENGPTKASITLFDQYGSQQIGQQEDAQITEKVNSFETKDILVHFPNNLEVGSYWANINVYNGDESVADGKMVFEVKPISTEGTEKTNYSALAYIIMAVIILALGAMFLKKKKVN